jgi:hypothetical protein
MTQNGNSHWRLVRIGRSSSQLPTLWTFERFRRRRKWTGAERASRPENREEFKVEATGETKPENRSGNRPPQQRPQRTTETPRQSRWP